MTPRHPPRALGGLTTPTRRRRLHDFVRRAGKPTVAQKDDFFLMCLLPYITHSFGIRLRSVPWASHDAPIEQTCEIYCMPCRSSDRSSVSQRKNRRLRHACQMLLKASPKEPSNPPDIVRLGSNGILMRSTALSQSKLRRNLLRNWHAGQGPMPTPRQRPASSGPENPGWS